MKVLRNLTRLTVLSALAAGWLAAGIYLYLGPRLPSVDVLRDVRLQTPMRVYSMEGDLIGQFGEQRRNPLTFSMIPQQFVQALLAAEDDGFFSHSGIALSSLARAVSELVLTGAKGSGGSTLTMQVARNYFLTRDRTFTRKFSEILLALEIERQLGKEEIFELYVNRVFLGHRAYGFEAAAQVYYGKSIDQLTLSQLAMLAGLPKAPSAYNPIADPVRAQIRRDWILRRMAGLGYITTDAMTTAQRTPDNAVLHGARLDYSAPYVAEMARLEMLERFGQDAYTDGYHVFTTISTRLQQAATTALEQGLEAYDVRHGYRGAEQRLRWRAAEVIAMDDASAGDLPPQVSDESLALWRELLTGIGDIGNRRAAAVTAVGERELRVLLRDGSEVTLAWDNGLSAARPYRSVNARGPAPQRAEEIAAIGDLIRIRPTEAGGWELTQVPEIQGALVALNPDDGAILSAVGGLGFALSKFNRVTQAERQPGSSFKPFLYAAALSNGFTPASIINDAPVVFRDSNLEGFWRPENDGGTFLGPTRLRTALTRSRNLVSIRVLQALGVGTAIEYFGRFGFDVDKLPRDLSLALGSHAVTPLDMARAYAVLANGGYRVEPYLISRVEDYNRNTVFEALPATVCRTCGADNGFDSPEQEGGELTMAQILANNTTSARSLPPAPRVMDERVNYLLTSMMRDVIRSGTGRRARALGREDIAGKTGTTNGPLDAWFAGYHREIATIAWMGFDQNKPLGRLEYGGTAALPVWIDFMQTALEGVAVTADRIPSGVVSLRIDPETGLAAAPGQRNALFEFFLEEQAPALASEGRSSTTDLLRQIF